MSHPPTGTVTFLFTDIEGSTRLWDDAPTEMASAVARHDALLREAIEQAGGQVFKTVGDAFHAAFDDPFAAFEAALASQRVLAAEDWGATPIRVRMAVHSGTAEARDGDFYGTTLNLLARLLALGYGGQTLASSATRELLRHQLPPGAELLDLGRHRLRDLRQAEQVFQLNAPGLEASFPVLKGLDTVPNNLPIQASALLGRQEELAGLLARLPEARLITLVGPGGTGKTRLALQVAAEALDRFPDGAWFVDLSPLEDEALVPRTVAGVLGLRDRAGQTVVESLLEYLAELEVLLVLDNCEQVVEAAARLAEALAGAGPGVRVLATSREALRISAEQVWRLDPLPLPDWSAGGPAGEEALAELSRYAAVQLFVERAMAVRPDFTLTRGNAGAVVEICARLDGLPLAIELAAARVTALTPEQIRARLDQRFQLLTTGRRTASRRQQTLEGAIDWSHDLLTEPARAVFRRLAAHRGDWGLASAEEVAAGTGVAEFEVFDVLADLVDKSLVVAADHEALGERRYRFLDSVRLYAREKLEASGERTAARDRHLAHFLALAERNSGRAGQPAWPRFAAERDNFRSAFDWALASAEPVPALRIAVALSDFWFVRGELNESRQQLETALAAVAGDAPPSLWVHAKTALGILHNHQADYPAARVVLEAALAEAREAADPSQIGYVLNNLGIALTFQGEHEAAARALREGLELFRAAGDQTRATKTLVNLANLAEEMGDYDTARRFNEEAVAYHRRMGNAVEEALALGNLGGVARLQGDTEAAVRVLVEATELHRQLGHKINLNYSLTVLGELAADRREFAEARAHCGEALLIAQEIGDKPGQLRALECWARIDSLDGQPARAARLLGTIDAARERLGTPPSTAAAAGYAGVRALVSEAIGPEATAAAESAGRDLPLDAAVAELLAAEPG